ncbi:MAG: hypothetical protein LBF22_13815 [Deltaproteobacteria bacterium]|nr:hypothetical protein [Deltaproteobacteria bacterium]
MKTQKIFLSLLILTFSALYLGNLSLALAEDSARIQLAQNNPQAAPKVLIVYFSHTGNTKAVAEYIQSLTEGTLFEIVPTVPYPENYDTCVKIAEQELKTNARPALKGSVADIGSYDIIFLGFPIWFGEAPMPVLSFLTTHDLSRKTIAPFSTSGSGDNTKAIQNIQKIIPKATFLERLIIRRGSLSQTQNMTFNWLKSLQIQNLTLTQGANNNG